MGLHEALHRDFPDEERRAGPARMGLAADLGVLHAVSAAALAGRAGEAAAEAHEQVEWSMLHAEDAGLPGVDRIVSMDVLREERSSRADQRANAEVLRRALEELDAALREGATVVWDATALNRHQRSRVLAVARRRGAFVTHAVAMAPEEILLRRHARREHPVPDAVPRRQLRRFDPPYPGEAHRTWYVGPDGRIGDVAGSLEEER
ncbi:ATP-binding protein [Thermomonospora catenispora]|uniref:ATP-binding protein n=1 Tax=Thermomonospora catenispora TaxID=2493090 RepID=UPI0019D50CFE|nr:ATP-binding protein [Thermomonospora catenispora]